MEKYNNEQNGSDELIRKYLKNQLSPSEKQSLEMEISKDTNLQAKTKFIQGLIQIHEQPALAQAGSVLLKLRDQKLATLPPKEKNGSTISKTTYVFRNPAFSQVLILTLVILLSIFLINQMNGNREKLFSDNLIAHPGMLNLPLSPENKLYYPVKYYMNEDWKDATDAFQKIRTDELIYEFHYVVASINTPDKSIQDYQTDILSLLTLKQDLIKKDEALHKLLVDWINYYIALIQIKQGNYRAGKKKVLELISRETILDPSLQEAVSKLMLQI